MPVQCPRVSAAAQRFVTAVRFASFWPWLQNVVTVALAQRVCDRPRQAAVRSLDGIIDTVSAKHELSQLLPLLDVDGTLVLLGAPTEPHTFAASSVLFSRCSPLPHCPGICQAAHYCRQQRALQPVHALHSSIKSRHITLVGLFVHCATDSVRPYVSQIWHIVKGQRVKC